jgi:hypothetical protein
MNAVCPNVIRTNISAPVFYDKLDDMGLLTPMEGLIEAFESMLGSNGTSGEIFEVYIPFAQFYPSFWVWELRLAVLSRLVQREAIRSKRRPSSWTPKARR